MTTTELLERAVKQVAFAMRATAAAVILPDEEGEIIEAAFDASDPPAFGLESLRSQPVTALPLMAALRESVERSQKQATKKRSSGRKRARKAS